MTKISVKNIKNEIVKDLVIKDSIWKVEPNIDCLKKMIKLQLAATRQGTAKTKTRAEVSGGGRKPWRQKGTGRARAGSNRSPIWRGGGIVFGVIPRDYAFKINRKERLVALKTALTQKHLERKLVVIDKLILKTPKTKDLKQLLTVLALTGKTLIVTAEVNENLFLASRNLSNLKISLPSEINCYDLVNATNLVCDEAALQQIEEVLK